MIEDNNFIKGLKKLLDKCSEVKISYYNNVFYVKFPINNETLEDTEYLESLEWEEIDYFWIYRLIK